MNIEEALRIYSDTWFVEKSEIRPQLTQKLSDEDRHCFLELTEIVDKVSGIVYLKEKESLFQRIAEERENVEYVPKVANFRTENNTDVSDETRTMIDGLFRDILGDKDGK